MGAGGGGGMESVVSCTGCDTGSGSEGVAGASAIGAVVWGTRATAVVGTSAVDASGVSAEWWIFDNVAWCHAQNNENPRNATTPAMIPSFSVMENRPHLEGYRGQVKEYHRGWR